MKRQSSSPKKTILLFILLTIAVSSHAQVRTAIDFKVQLDTTLYVKTVPLEVLQNTDSLTIARYAVRVTSFRSTFIYKGGNRANLVDEPSQSNKLTPTMKAAIGALQKGDRILIDNITVLTKGNKQAVAPGVVFTVN